MHSLVNHHQENNGVDVEICAKDGTVRHLCTRTLLACDGARSHMRTQLDTPIHDL
ncbi:hypothetical protein [Paraburkholderia tropica]|uniref:hypothetical protein n=1 Tax=Paraburkholderia tropica TaxID=92647 RepID=UPI002AB747D1|nr:hypothetical protein [Paraburkholderia tropica]